MKYLLRDSLIVTVYWFLAFAMSALVTYHLPGTSKDEAFVDVMAILISLSFFAMGVFYGVVAIVIPKVIALERAQR